jgi:PAS domain S-box-containing protein
VARPRTTKQRYDIVMGAINESVYDWDLVRNRFWTSESMQRLLGLSPEHLTLDGWRKSIHPDDYARFRDATVAHLKGQTERFECEYRFRSGDGTWHWARTHGLAVRDKRGRAVRMVGSTGDITELKRAEERYELATSAAIEGIYEWDLGTGRLFLSARAKALFLLPDQDLTTAAWNGRIHGDDFAGYRQAIIDHFKGRTPQLEHEYRIADGQGGYRWVLERGIGVRDDQRRVIRMVGALSDVTRRRQALEQLTATAEVLKVTASSPTDVQPVFEAILANALRLCEASFAAVFMFDGELLRNVAHLNASPEFARFLGSAGVRPSRETTTRRCALERRTIHTRDLMNDPEFSPPEAQRREKVRTSLSVPMFRESTLVGVISLWRSEVRPFTDKQIALVETFADQAAIAIENVRLFNQTREALEQQTATAEILQITARSPSDVQPVFDAIARNAMQLCDGSHCALFRFDGRLQHFAAHHGVDPQTVDLLRRIYPRAPDPARISGRAILEREVIHLADALSDARFPGSAETLTSAGNRSVLAVPMLKAGEPIGVIFMVRREPRRFSDRQVALLKTFADQAVIAIENVRLFNETRAALEQQKASSEVLHAISSSIADTAPVFDKILESCQRLFAGTIVGLNLVRDDGMLHIGAYQGAHRGEFERIFPIPLTLESGSGLAILEHRVVHYPDATRDEVPERTRRGCKAIGVRSAIFAPVLWEGRGLGAIFVGRDHASSFSEKEIALLRTFADQAAIAIENVRLFNETKEALEQQKASGEVLQAISSSIADTAPVFDKILESCQRLFAGTIVGLNLLGEDNMMRIGAYHGPHREQFERIFPVAPGRSIEERRVVHYPDAEHGADVPVQTREGCRAIGIRSVIFAPVLWEGRALGSIFVGRDRISTFSGKETTLLKTFADQAAIAIENARLFKEIQDKSRQLEIASRHKSEFLANMSHELRTPLNAIIGFTRIVMRRSKEVLEAQQYENLEKILASGQNLLALINQVLDLSKVEAGRVEVHASQVALAPVLEQCLRTIEPLVKVALVKELDAGLPVIFTDEEKLRQIVINLLSNAARFTERGRIRLQAQAANGSVAISVDDTGAGIAADKLDLIFEAFEQGDGAGHGGTGLGLTIARRLARLMGGDIVVQSTRGTGSRFTLTLPLRYPA